MKGAFLSVLDFIWPFKRNQFKHVASQVLGKDVVVALAAI